MIPIVYICAPFSAPSLLERDRNVNRALLLGRLAVLSGFAPIVVHPSIDSVFGDDNDPAARARGLACNLAVCELVAHNGGALWILLRDDGTMSPGCECERAVWSMSRAEKITAHTWAGWRALAGDPASHTHFRSWASQWDAA